MQSYNFFFTYTIFHTSFYIFYILLSLNYNNIGCECVPLIIEHDKIMFRFKQFTIHQNKCAMKVGTDGVLLGAWAMGGKRILDIGTGTGLIALMIAQRFPDAIITAIDIDNEACNQAKANVSESPFSERINIIHSSLQEFAETNFTFDAIVSNPPFFEDSLECPDAQRTAARHTSSLSFRDLIRHAAAMLTTDGTLSIIIPTDRFPHVETEAILQGLYLTRRTDVKTVERKAPKRTLLTFSKHRPDNIISETQILMTNNHRSDWYNEITKDFYLTL